MKSAILFFFILITQFCLGQNNDLIKNEAIVLFNDGKVKEALNTLEQIKDKKTLENTDVNTWKKHFKDILDYKFSDGYVINDSIKTVFVKTSLLTHFGIYNLNTKKYLKAPIYDDIPKADAISKYLVISLNHQKGLVDLSGKTIIPLGNYEINVNYKYIAVVSNEGNSVKAIYNWDGKLVGNNLAFFQGVNQNYIITQNDSNKFQLLKTGNGLLVIEDCDKIENIFYGGSENIQEVFIKKDNNYAIYNFVTNSFSARNDFDKIIRNINVFSNYLKGTSTDQAVSEKNRFIIVKKSSKSGIYDLVQKKYFTEPVYDSITGFGNCLRNNVWGNIKYEYPIKEDYGQSEAVVYIKNNHFGLKSVSNKTITDAEYDEIVQKTGNLFLTKKQKLWGWVLVENNKTSIIKPQFDFLYLANDEKYDATKPITFDRPYSTSLEPYLVACFTDKTKQFSLDGKERSNPKSINEKVSGKKTYLSSLSYNSNRIVTTQKQLTDPNKGIYQDVDVFGLDDKSGNEIVKPIYKGIDIGLNGNEYIVLEGGIGLGRRVGVIDENGKTIISAAYHSIDLFNDNYYLVETSDHYVGLFDKDGKEVIPIIYKEIKVFLDSLYIVKDKDNLYKIIDAKNQTIYIFPKYTESIYKFEKITSNKGEVLYSVSFRLIDGYYNWYDHFLIKLKKNLGTRILENYHIQEVYENHIIQLESNYLIGFYDLNNQKLIEPQFKEVKRYYSNRLIYCKTDKYFDTTVDYNLNITTSKDHISAIINDVIYYEQNGNYGFFNKNDQKTKNTFQTIEAEPFVRSPKLYKYYDNKNKSKAGLVNENGEIVIEANLYDNIYPRSDKFLLSNKETSQILICTDKSGETANKIDFVTLSGNKIAGMTTPKNHYLVDFISKNGLVLLKAPYETIFFDLNENKIISKVNSASVIKDEDGGFTVLVNEASISDFKKVSAQKYSTNGNLISTRIIDRNQSTRTLENWNFYLTQKRENKYGIVGVDEKVIVPFVYDTIMPSVNTIYIAKKNNKFGIIDRESNILSNFEYDKIETEYLEEYRNHERIDDIHIEKRAPQQTSFDFIVSKDHKTGIIGPTLKSILPVEYDSFRKNRTLFSNIIARKGKNSMVYSNQGNFLFQVECDSLIDYRYYDQLYYKIFKNNKQGFLNHKGIQVFPLLYPKAEKTKFENLFILERDSKKYIADSKGEIISKGYDKIDISKFNDYLEVKINNKFGLINNKGTIVIPEIYDTMYQIRGSSYVVISSDNKSGLIDLNAKANKILPIKIPTSYSNIEQIVNKKYIIVYNNSKKGVIDLNNKVLIPLIYDSINYHENRNYFISNNNGLVINITPDNVIIKVEE